MKSAVTAKLFDGDVTFRNSTKVAPDVRGDPTGRPARAKGSNPPELREQMAEMDNFSVGVPEFFDLREPGMRCP